MGKMCIKEMSSAKKNKKTAQLPCVLPSISPCPIGFIASVPFGIFPLRKKRVVTGHIIFGFTGRREASRARPTYNLGTWKMALSTSLVSPSSSSRL